MPYQYHIGPPRDNSDAEEPVTQPAARKPVGATSDVEKATQVHVVENFRDLHALRDAWNDLALRAHTATIFQSYELHAAWWRALGAGSKPFVVLAEVDGTLAGIAPLMISERRLLARRRRVCQFIGTRSFDYADFIIDRDCPELLPRLVNALFERSPAFDLLHLRDIPGHSPTVSALADCAAVLGLHIGVQVLYQAPTRLFNNPEADAALPRKTSLRRHHKALAREGRVEFANLRSAEDILPLLDTFFEQHVARRARTESPSVFVDAAARDFFREVVHRLAPTGQLLFSVLTLDGRPVAMHFGFERNRVITWYKPSFEIALSRLSPGEVLIKHLFEYALESGAVELDFTIGEEAFKYRFANHVRENVSVRVYRHRPDYHVERALSSARAFVERSPMLRRAARRVLWRWRDRL